MRNRAPGRILAACFVLALLSEPAAGSPQPEAMRKALGLTKRLDSIDRPDFVRLTSGEQAEIITVTPNFDDISHAEYGEDHVIHVLYRPASDQFRELTRGEGIVLKELGKAAPTLLVVTSEFVQMGCWEKTTHLAFVENWSLKRLHSFEESGCDEDTEETTYQLEFRDVNSDGVKDVVVMKRKKSKGRPDQTETRKYVFSGGQLKLTP